MHGHSGYSGEMNLPPYFVSRPHMDLDGATVTAFERLYAEAVVPGSGAEIVYTLPVPKWQFLCYLTDRKDLLVHGSGNPHIETFEPRQSNDMHEFGNRKAVFATSDALWAMYFAIVDRDRKVSSLVNVRFRVVGTDGSRSEPSYFFSINADALSRHPWRNGTIYLLPRTPFEQQPLGSTGGFTVEIAQWASLKPVAPLARLAVGPEDFPLLASIRGHDPEVVRQRAERDPDPFSWFDV